MLKKYKTVTISLPKLHIHKIYLSESDKDASNTYAQVGRITAFNYTLSLSPRLVSDKLTNPKIISIAAHESSHVCDMYLADITSYDTCTEMRAYVLQSISEQVYLIIEEFLNKVVI